MYSGSVLVLALAVFGATAQPFVSNGLGCGGSPVFENAPIRLPGFVSPTSVQDTCSCVKTIVRPQIRKEVFTIPSVQRFVQTTSTTPVVETLPYVKSAALDVPTGGSFGAFGSQFVGGVGSFGSQFVGGVANYVPSGVTGPAFGLSTVGAPALGGVVSGYGVSGCSAGLGNGIVSTGLAPSLGVC